MVSVMSSRPIRDALAFPDRIVIREGNRLGMRDQESVETAGLGRPGAHPGARSRAIQIDRAARAHSMSAAIERKVLLVRAPTEFGGLRAFADEAVDRPGIDEVVVLLRDIRDLAVAFGDMHDLDAEL